MIYTCTGCELTAWCLAHGQFLPTIFGKDDWVLFNTCDRCGFKEISCVSWKSGFYVHRYRVMSGKPPCYDQIPEDKRRVHEDFHCPKCGGMNGVQRMPEVFVDR